MEVSGEVALEAAGGLAAAFPFLDSTLDVVDGRLVCSASGNDDLVECSVELSVAAAVEPVPDRLAGRGRDWGGAGESRECGLADHAAAVLPGEQDLGGEQWTGLVEQLRGELGGELLDLPRQLTFLSGQLLDASSDCAEGEQRSA